MAINFFDYVSKYDFVPFAELIENDDFKVLSSSKASMVSEHIKDIYKAKSDVKIEFKPETIKKENSTLRFRLQKAHMYASDPDGYLRYKLTAINGNTFVSNNKNELEHDLGEKKYDDVIEIAFSKNLMQTVRYIDFYFKDNTDAWIDLKGDLPEQWEHCGRVTIGAGSSCFCNRDFKVEEVRNIVKELRNNTYYNEKPIIHYHQDKLFHRNTQTKEEYKQEIILESERNFNKLTEVLNNVFKNII